MIRRRAIAGALAGLLAAVAIAQPTSEPERSEPKLSEPQRSLAVTVDDLPCSACQRFGGWLEVTEGLVDALVAAGAPAIGFVNESKLEVDGEVAPERVALLRRWLDAGLELGNHSYSHSDLHRSELADFQADVLRGERVTRRLYRQADREPSRLFFRHPYLHTGRHRETKRELERFLAEHGYAVAPVTIDNSEWIFARAYDHAVAAGSEADAERVVEAYLPYMAEKAAYFERLAEAVVGRPLPQILLVHANRLNAVAFGRLAKLFVERGYRFVSLAEALADPAYRRPDDYLGPAGLSWLERWALAGGRGKELLKQDPPAPRWILELAEIDSE